jgi:hypothetical protein
MIMIGYSNYSKSNIFCQIQYKYSARAANILTLTFNTTTDIFTVHHSKRAWSHWSAFIRSARGLTTEDDRDRTIDIQGLEHMVHWYWRKIKAKSNILIRTKKVRARRNPKPPKPSPHVPCPMIHQARLRVNPGARPETRPDLRGHSTKVALLKFTPQAEMRYV